MPLPHRQTGRKYNAMVHILRLFNGLFSRTTWLSQYQKGKTSLDLNEARNDGFGDAVASAGLSICTSFQTDNHIKKPSLDFYRPDALPDAQPTVSKQAHRMTEKA